MAYYLQKTSAEASARVDLATRIDFMRNGGAGYTGDWEIEFEAEMTGSSLVLMGQNTSQSDRILFFTNTTTIELRRPASPTLTFTLPASAAARRVYRIIGRSATDDIAVFQDGVSCGTGAASDLFFVQVFFPFGSSSRTADLYYCKFYNDALLVHDLDPSASSGTGSTLPDTAGTNDGTLVNFPTDDSQWVFYAAGGSDSATTVGIESTSEVGTPSVGQNHSLTTNGVESASEVGNQAVGQNHSLTTTGIESASQVGTPTAGEVAGGDSAVTAGVESASETGTPSVGQNHVLSTNGLDSASEVGQPSVGQVHIISSTGIESASTVGNPTALSVTGLLLGIKPSLSISVTEYSVTLAAPVYSFTVSQPKYTIQVTQPNYTVIQ